MPLYKKNEKDCYKFIWGDFQNTLNEKKKNKVQQSISTYVNFYVKKGEIRNIHI